MIDDSAGDSLWNAAVDAENGRLLDTDDWTSKDTLGQLSTLKRTGSGSVAQSSAAAGAAAAAQVNDGSSYNVLAFPTESPNDAPRQIVANPADAIASPFGWHDTSGVLGAEFTIDAGQQRPRVSRPGQQQRRGLRRQPGRRGRASPSTSRPT